MQIKRVLKHLLYPGWMSRRRLPKASLDRIEAAIARAEASHHGEICVAVESALDLRALLLGQTARARALQVFAEQGVWDTEANNGVLIYLLLADRAVEIVADRGVARQLQSTHWESVSQALRAQFGQGAYEAGLLQAIAAVGGHLARLYPRSGSDVNELPDRPIEL
jgi:uncharacterized membrane protein